MVVTLSYTISKLLKTEVIQSYKSSLIPCHLLPAYVQTLKWFNNCIL